MKKNIQIRIKHSLRTSFRNTLWYLRKAMLDNRSHVIIHNSHKATTRVIEQLYQYGIIEAFEQKGRYIFVKLAYFYASGTQGHRPRYTGVIQALPRSRHGVNYSAKSIQRYQRYGGQQKLGFFSTDNGVVNSEHASRARLGGLPLFQVK